MVRLALLLGLVVVSGCSKAQPPAGTETPPPSAQVDGPSVPMDAEGWPVGWPEKGVVIVWPSGAGTFYVPGPKPDEAHAPHWPSAQLDDEAATKASVAMRRAASEAGDFTQ